MLEEGSLVSRTRHAAKQPVLTFVRSLRQQWDSARAEDQQPTVRPTEVDALERKLERLRADHAWQIRKSDGEPDISGTEAVLVTIVDTPNGTITSQRPKWASGARVRARELASRLADKIAELEIEIAQRRAADVGDHTGAEEGGLTIIESEKTIEQLKAESLRVN
jgi:hypothetical protein